MSRKYFALSALPLAIAAHAHASNSSIPPISEDTLVITASKFEQLLSSVLAPMSVITRDDLAQMQTETLTDALKTLPGIEIGQSGGRGQSASIFLRGTESNHVLVMIDGVRLPRTMMGTVDFNMLPLNMIEQIEVIRGSGATIYGSDAIGGVINIITRNDQEQTRFGLRFGSFDHGEASLGLTRKLNDDWSIQIATGFEHGEGYNVHPEYAAPDTTHGYDGKNLTVRLGFDDSARNRINLVGTWYQNQLAYDSFGEKKMSFVESAQVAGDWTYTHGEKQSQLKLSLGRQENYDHLATDPKNAAALTSEIQQMYASFNSRIQLSEPFSIVGGLDWTSERYLAGSFIDVSRIADNPRDNLGIYGLSHWAFAPSWQLEASVRHDQNDQFGGNQTGLLALGWDLTGSHRLFASIGNAFKAPGFDALYGTGGNLALQPEKSTNVEIGLEGQNFDIGWSVNAYFNQIDDLIVYTGTWPDGRNENIDKAEIRGLELMADFDLGPTYHQVSLELKDPMDVGKNEVLARRAKQSAKWQTSYVVGDLTLTGQYQYQSERLDYSGGEMLPSYSLFDAGAQYQMSSHTSVGLKLNNVLDQSYETAGGYPAPERNVMLNIDFVY